MFGYTLHTPFFLIGNLLLFLVLFCNLESRAEEELKKRQLPSLLGIRYDHLSKIKNSVDGDRSDGLEISRILYSQHIENLERATEGLPPLPYNGFFSNPGAGLQ